jgi:hypothetical protein
VITDSGDRDHADHGRQKPGVRVAALHAADVSVGCMVMAGPVKPAANRPWSPWRGPARDVQRPPRVWRSGARGEALWTPVGDQATGGHAVGLSAATSGRRIDGPFSSIRWAR